MDEGGEGIDGGDVLANVNAASFEVRAKAYQAAFRSFLDARCRADVQSLLQSLVGGGPRTRTPNVNDAHVNDASQKSFAYSLRVCAQTLLDFNPGVGTLLFRHPDQFLSLFHAALAQEVTAASARAGGVGFAALPLKTRQKLKVRVEFLPPVAPLRKPTISTIRSNDVKQLIQIAGTVVRTGMIKMQETSREYQCSSTRCGYRFLVKSDPEQGNILELPKVCPSETSGKPCKSTQFDVVEHSRVVSDHQVIKIQEQVSRLGVGSIPRSILVVLEDDLVDSVKAGDHVVVVGILMRCWRPVVRDIRCDLETIVKANSIRLTNATAARVLVTEELKAEFARFWRRHARDPVRGRNEIVASICPKVYGLFVVKLGVALTVIGGCARVDEAGMKTRGEPHMLLIGDPGTGKSQFLRFTAELSPRSVLTTGIGTTSAGLTCTAVKDGGDVDVAVNTAIGSPLLSRFDLVLVLLDRMNRRWDEAVSAFILQQSTEPSGGDKPEPSEPTDDRLWPIPKLQAYVCYVKDKYEPALSRSAITILQRYYQRQRSSDTRSAARTTLRLLESLTRLAQAHARLMCRDDVGVMDAVVAVFVMEVSRATDSGGASVLGGGAFESALHSDFADDPGAEYALQERTVLESLGLLELATSANHPRSGSQQQQDTQSYTQYTQRSDPPVKRGGEYDNEHASVPLKRHRGLDDPPVATAGSSQRGSWTQRLSGGVGHSDDRSTELKSGGDHHVSPNATRPRFPAGAGGRWSQQTGHSVTSKWRK
ncbi:hypothetical protein PybrP1_000124 [[Pythium] brassicae (nom. inval.)]|nr:hypothetical protein PybrP1_000124 [[Pythium] brassicae (nom. inval.)]